MHAWGSGWGWGGGGGRTCFPLWWVKGAREERTHTLWFVTTGLKLLCVTGSHLVPVFTACIFFCLSSRKQQWSMPHNPPTLLYLFFFWLSDYYWPYYDYDCCCCLWWCWCYLFLKTSMGSISFFFLASTGLDTPSASLLLLGNHCSDLSVVNAHNRQWQWARERARERETLACREKHGERREEGVLRKYYMHFFSLSLSPSLFLLPARSFLKRHTCIQREHSTPLASCISSLFSPYCHVQTAWSVITRRLKKCRMCFGSSNKTAGWSIWCGID